MTTMKASAKAEAFAKRHNAAIAAKQLRWAEDEARRRERAERVEPTQQRLSKGDLQKAVCDGGLRYRPKDDLLALQEANWPEDIVEAFHQFQSDSFAADLKGISGRYDGMPASAKFGKGGLGDAHPEQVKIYNRFVRVRGGLTPDSRQLCDWFILNQCPPNEREHRMLAYGKRLRRNITDTRSLRFATEGRLLGAGHELVALYHAVEMEQRAARARK